MKKFISILALLLALTVSSSAMSYEQARQQALFLTDKMAYELNLTDDQYEAAYEINLDYLMSVNTYDDLYGAYWRYRNTDLSYVLLDWQYRAYCAANYFYRPLYFDDGFWHFAIYSRYPHRDYFYFHRPTVYVSYRGGHSWGTNHGRSWYHGRNFGPRPGKEYFGMRDGFKRGDFGNGNRQSFGSRQPSRPGNGNMPTNGTFGNRQNNTPLGNRGSSTRTTVTRPSTPRFDNNRPTLQSNPRSTFTPSRQGNMPLQRPQGQSPVVQRPGGSQSQPSFGSNRGSFGGGSRMSLPQSQPSRGGGASQPSRGGFGSRR